MGDATADAPAVGGSGKQSQPPVLDREALQQFRAEVVARRNLATIPAVLWKILALLDSDGTSARELVGVIEQDQALTAKILRLANSAFFGQARRVATIPRAIVVLGFSTVRNLTLGVRVWDAVAGGLTRERFEALWTHAVAVAIASKTLALRMRDCDPDEAFTAGLVHDVGRLVMATRFRELYWQQVGSVSEAEPIEERERAAFGADHAEVGGWLFEAWNLPPQIVDAVRDHHAVEMKPGLPGLLTITNRLVSWTDLETGAVRPEALALLEMVADRGITAERWEELVTKLRAGGTQSFLGAVRA